MTNYLTRPHGKEVGNQLPLQVHNVAQSGDNTAISGETVTFNSAAAASSTGVNALDKRPILNLSGGQVGSYWGLAQNRMMLYKDTSVFGTLTETAASASMVITDVTNNLIILFEATSGARRYILKATDSSGAVLYGWIGDITASGNVYTIPVHNHVTTGSGAQSWVGTLASFDNSAVKTVEIFAYTSSLVWVTGTVLTEEVVFEEEYVMGNMKTYFDSLSAGQYGVNYRTGQIYFKKATTGTSDTVNYSHPGGASGASINIDQVGGDTVSAANTARTTSTKVIPVQIVDQSGNVTDTVSTTAAVTTVDDTASSVSLLAANLVRKGVVIHNNSTSILYIKYGATATTASGGYTYKIPADGTFEMLDHIYTGAIDGIWSANSTGAASITEY